MCSLWKPICGVIIILQDFLHPNGVSDVVATIGKNPLLLKMDFLMAGVVFFLFLVIRSASVLYI